MRERVGVGLCTCKGCGSKRGVLHQGFLTKFSELQVRGERRPFDRRSFAQLIGFPQTGAQTQLQPIMPSEARHVGIIAAVDAEQRPNEQANTDGPLVVPKGVSTRREGVERASVQLPLLVLHGKLRGMESGRLVLHLLRSRRRE